MRGAALLALYRLAYLILITSRRRRRPAPSRDKARQQRMAHMASGISYIGLIICTRKRSVIGGLCCAGSRCAILPRLVDLLGQRRAVGAAPNAQRREARAVRRRTRCRNGRKKHLGASPRRRVVGRGRPSCRFARTHRAWRPKDRSYSSDPRLRVQHTLRALQAWAASLHWTTPRSSEFVALQHLRHSRSSAPRLTHSPPSRLSRSIGASHASASPRQHRSQSSVARGRPPTAQCVLTPHHRRTDPDSLLARAASRFSRTRCISLTSLRTGPTTLAPFRAVRRVQDSRKQPVRRHSRTPSRRARGSRWSWRQRTLRWVQPHLERPQGHGTRRRCAPPSAIGFFMREASTSTSRTTWTMRRQTPTIRCVSGTQAPDWILLG